MRKVFNKALAGVTSATLIATLALGVNFTSTVKADEATAVDTVWSFTQGGQYNPDDPANTGYIKSVSVGNETLANWERDKSTKQTQTASKASTEFTLNIENTGWDAQWSDVTGYPTNPYVTLSPLFPNNAFFCDISVFTVGFLYNLAIVTKFE